MRIRALAAAALLLGIAACNPQPQHAPSATPSPSPSGMPPLTITGKGTAKQPIKVTGQHGNRKVYALVTKSYTSRSVQTVAQATFEKPTVTFYDKDGTKLTAQSPQASVANGKLVTLSGGVHATTSTGINLTCDTLAYDQNTGMLHGTGHVRITGQQGGQPQVLTGNEFTSDVKLTQMVLK